MPDPFAFDLTAWQWVGFAVAGVVTGVVNTLAGSGSLVTLPVFVFVCGLPPTVANGTNRIGVLVQSAVGVREFARTGQTDFTGSGWILAAGVVGALLGARIAVDLSEQAMSYTIGTLMVVMLVVLLVKPSRWLHELPADPSRNRRPLTLLAFFALGVYGGFIQAGVGVFMLAVLVLVSRYTLTAANGIKLLIVLAYAVPVLLVYFASDQVHVGYGLAMALFQAVGAWLGVRFVVRVPNADVWIHRLLVAVVAAAAVKFFV